MPTAVN